MRVQLPIALCLLAALWGCAREQPRFDDREELTELVRPVQEHIQKTLHDHFGTPTDMVAWERLPIHYHVASGVLTDVESAGISDKPGGAQLGVNLIEQNRPIEPGDPITFLSGIYLNAPGEVTVEAWNDENGLLTIQQAGFDPVPEVGDRIVIGAGRILEQGRMLYAEHCQHCHGVSGDGNGPTARYLNPRPRDYRLGLFKFTSTKASDKASRDDLARTIAEGIPGTYMPSFKLLTDEEMQAIVEYVLWLSMRGEVENGQIRSLMLDFSKEAIDERDDRDEAIEELQAYLTEDWPDIFDDDTKFLAEQWENAQLESAVVYPTTPRVPDTPESRAEGRRLFSDAKTKCDTCHGPQGRGDGGQTISVQKDPNTNQDYPLPGLYDNWGNPLNPRDLTKGIYRGGRRPIDLYRRMHAGIKGTPMPPFGTVLKDEEIWHLVNYVLSIPFEAREQRPGDGAHESLPESQEVATTGASAETSD